MLFAEVEIGKLNFTGEIEILKSIFNIQLSFSKAENKATHILLFG